MAKLEQAKVVYLGLPKLPNKLKTKIIKLAKDIELDESARIWTENFHKNTIRAVSHVYGRGATILTNDMLEEVNAVYSPYFNERIFATVGKLENTYTDGLPAESPPHCDRQRQMSINYLLTTGGDDVRTCFFKNPRHTYNLAQAENDLYENLELDFKITIPAEHWHSYNVQYYHSVENIYSQRLIFSIVLESNPDFDTFKQKYQNLILEPLCIY